MEKIKINTKDLYQFLITECRYGYTRNNHLMPSGAYQHVYEYLPIMEEVDEAMAIATAIQLSEECINSELIQFIEDIVDENGNLFDSIKFIDAMVEFVNKHEQYVNWKPYNYKQYLKTKLHIKNN